MATRKLPPGFVEILRQVNTEGTLPFEHRMKEAWRRYKTQSKRYSMRRSTENPEISMALGNWVVWDHESDIPRVQFKSKSRAHKHAEDLNLKFPSHTALPRFTVVTTYSAKDRLRFKLSKNPRKKKGHRRCPSCGGLFRGRVCPVCIKTNPKFANISEKGIKIAEYSDIAAWYLDKNNIVWLFQNNRWSNEGNFESFKRKVDEGKTFAKWVKNPRKKKLSHPVSERQRRWAFAAEKRGELKRGTAIRWARRVKRRSKNPIAIYNPNIETRIPATNIAISYRRSSGEHVGKWFRHSFGNTVSMYGLDNGSIMLRSNKRKKLWGTVD